ncbi:MAG: hypothetical protein HFH08_03185 [Bacilli bacterium]|nr:hypothetical protein [Bacilli bacterium]
MKKLDNKGFMLTETLVVATFVIATLVFLYTQFRTVNRSYSTSFKYNNAEELYALGNMGDYLKLNGMNVVGSVVTSSPEQYLDITSCSGTFLSETDYCKALVNTLGIKQIIVTSENLDSLKSIMKSNSHIPEEMKDFISVIKYDKTGTNYRLVAWFTNGTFASISI